MGILDLLRKSRNLFHFLFTINLTPLPCYSVFLFPTFASLSFSSFCSLFAIKTKYNRNRKKNTRKTKSSNLSFSILSPWVLEGCDYWWQEKRAGSGERNVPKNKGFAQKFGPFLTSAHSRQSFHFSPWQAEVSPRITTGFSPLPPQGWCRTSSRDGVPAASEPSTSRGNTPELGKFILWGCRSTPLPGHAIG